MYTVDSDGERLLWPSGIPAALCCTWQPDWCLYPQLGQMRPPHCSLKNGSCSLQGFRIVRSKPLPRWVPLKKAGFIPLYRHLFRPPTCTDGFQAIYIVNQSASQHMGKPWNNSFRFEPIIRQTQLQITKEIQLARHLPKECLIWYYQSWYHCISHYKANIRDHYWEWKQTHH